MEKKYRELLGIIPSVSRETMENLIAFESLLRQWNTHFNLISTATVPILWRRHILDSAQVYSLHSHLLQWCDFGSGGGFPALVIAIFLKETRRGHIDLVESNGKKTAFLRTVITQLNLPATVHHCRIEDVYEKIKKPEVITARGLAPLDILLGLIFPCLTDKTITLLQKGKDYAIEVKNSSKNWTFDLLKHQSKINEDSVILEISRIQSCKR